jgi:hypothetical protein
MTVRPRQTGDIRKGLVLNVLEVVLDNTEAVLPSTPYSEETWNTCTDEHDEIWFYRFQGRIYSLASDPPETNSLSEFTPTEITVDAHSPVFAQLIAERFHQFFLSEGPNAWRNAYDSTWEVHMPQAESKNIGQLSISPTLIYTVRPLYSTTESEQILALVLRTKLRHEFLEEDDIEAPAPEKLDLKWQRQGDEEEIYASGKNVVEYVSHLDQVNEYESYTEQFQGYENRFLCFRTHINRVNNVRGLVSLPGSLNITGLSPVTLPSPLFNVEHIEYPTHFFYQDRTPDPNEYLNDAVQRLLPRSYDKFAGDTIQVAVLAAKTRERQALEYGRTIKEKLETLFHLSKVELSFHTFEPTQNEIERFLRNFDASKYDVALPLMAESLKQIPEEKSPYHNIKARLLNQRVPSQDITIESVREGSRMINANLALNTYAKLGGTAWAVRRSDGTDFRQFVMGVGATTDDNGEFTIGFANVFSHDGRYLVGECHQLSSMDRYAESLEEYLTSALRNALEAEGVSEDSPVRLVIHLFKEAAHDREVEAIEEALGSEPLSAYNIKYAILHLSENHSYRMFKDGGADQPNQPTLVRLTNYQALLQMGPRREKPFLLKLKKCGDYRSFSLLNLARQVVDFSHLSHLSFLPPGTPVTVSYPNKIAKTASELRKVPDWDPSIMNRLSDRPWFI